MLLTTESSQHHRQKRQPNVFCLQIETPPPRKPKEKTINWNLIKPIEPTPNLQEMQKLEKQVKQLLKEAISQSQNMRCCTGKTNYFLFTKTMAWGERIREKRGKTTMGGPCLDSVSKRPVTRKHFWEGQISLNMDLVISEASYWLD